MVAERISLPEKLTPSEYLEHERQAECKSEYFDGDIYAMAGASRTHVQINFALIASLGPQLRGSGCEGFNNDLRVRVPNTNSYFYPDVVVACEPQWEDNQFDTLLNPKVVIEVLSPSTAAFDRDEKWRSYQTLESLSDYILVAQARPFIEQFTRQNDGSWKYRVVNSLEGEVPIESIHCTLRAADVYERVTFE